VVNKLKKGNSSVITIKGLLSNEPWEVEVESLGILVKCKDPTTKDKIDVRTEAKEHPLWEEMEDLEKATEISTRLVLKMIVDPKITYEDYLKSPSPKIDAIIESVKLAWYKKVKKLTDKNRKEMQDFLDQMKEQ